ncbi:MAG: hypothetical protein H8D45_00570 [Bacteroidetes bacterium]|nr:hypothetical protein [Bacteroidota bacterium]
MTRETLNYNIHDILSFQINRKRCRDFIKDINLPYSYFETEHGDNPDIILNLGDFTPENEGCYVVDHKWYIKNDYIYCSEHIGKIKFKIEIIGIESIPTIINVSTNTRNIRQLFLPSVLPQYIVLRPIIDFKLLCKEFVSIHAAAVANEKGAIIFLGRGGSFKTTLSMDYIRNLNYKFLGDNKMKINKNKAFSYPVHNKLFDYRVNKMNTENYSLLDKYKYLIYQRSNQYEPDYTIVDKTDISSMYLIAKSNGKQMRAEQLLRDDVLIKTVNSHKMENIGGPFLMGISKGLYDYFTAYSYVFPDSKIASYWDTYGSMLAEYLDADEYYEISLPKTYTKTAFQDFVELIHSLER